MFKKFLAGVALCALSTAAIAADLPARTAPAIAPVPVFTWSGAYMGLIAGAGWMTGTIDDKACNLSCSSLSLSSGGVSGGVTVGYNVQVGRNTVLGLEGDYALSTYKKALVDAASSNGGTHHQIQWNAIANVRGRAGIAIENTLFYATAGLALVDEKVTGRQGSCGAGAACFKQSGYRAGFAGGVGLKYAVSRNLSLKGENLHFPPWQAGEGFPEDTNIQYLRR